MEIGIIGLPNAGKTSLFNLLTRAAAQTGNFPFTTIEPNVGVAAVTGDGRLERLGEMYRPEKLTPATIRFVDVAGLVKNAHKGEGLGNMFLSHIRPLDAVAHVLREFISPEVADTGSSSPEDDRLTVETELLLADLEFAERTVSKLSQAVKSGDKTAAAAVSSLEGIIEKLRKGEMLFSGSVFDIPASAPFRFHDFLTAKPRFCVLNSTAPFRSPEPPGCVRVDVKLETEALEIPPGERFDFLGEYGINVPAAERVAREAARLLDLVAFYTVVGKEVRAWFIRRGSSAIAAAAAVHTDMAKGFIRAEVLSFDDLLSAGGEKSARSAGLVRAEGRDYAVRDGDIVRILFK